MAIDVAVVLGVIATGIFLNQAPKVQVVLLPQEDGTPTAVLISGSADTQTNVDSPKEKGVGVVRLDKPYMALVVDPINGKNKTRQLSPEQIDEEYSALFKNMPAKRHHYILRFKKGSSELDTQALKKVEQILQDVKNIPGSDVVVIGHTDTTGTLEENDQLSLRRAQSVAEKLISQGVSPSRIEAQGRGERELLEPTDDEVENANNRRVEIIVR